MTGRGCIKKGPSFIQKPWISTDLITIRNALRGLRLRWNKSLKRVHGHKMVGEFDAIKACP